MITRNEYRYLRKIEKNKVSDELIDMASQPDFLFDLEVIELSLKIKNPEDYYKQKEKEDFTKEERNTLALIDRMLRRKLIHIEQREYDRVDGVSHMFRYFELTDYGYNSMIEYRMKFKFWLPLVISLLSIAISVIH